MLQIISGKFFSDGPVNECDEDSILFANYSWIGQIKTNVAELRPVDTYGSRVAAYVVRYVNRYEPLRRKGTTMASTTAGEIQALKSRFGHDPIWHEAGILIQQGQRAGEVKGRSGRHWRSL